MFAMNIRKATTGDVQHLAAFSDAVPAEDIKAAVVQGRCWVYKDGDQPQGYAIIQPDFMRRPFVSLVFVAESHRRKGVASRLIRHLETVCGSDRIFTAANQNNTDMQSLLQKLDYQTCGEISGVSDTASEIVFMKRLG